MCRAMEAVTSLSFHSMVAGGQRDTGTELVEISG